MSNYPEDYVEKVLNDIEALKGKRKAKRANIFERATTKWCDPKILHANPYDEFSDGKIGPNFEIVGQYTKVIKNNKIHGELIFDEPVIIQKIDPDGYQIINGHHRWFAALRMGLEKLHVKIVNLVGEEEVKEMLDKTENVFIAVFDLDEVLFGSNPDDAAPITDALFANRFKERLRTGAPELINTLHEHGYDICVYTKSYMTVEEIDDFFSMYDIKIEGEVNGFGTMKKRDPEARARLGEMLKNRYKRSVHIDNEQIFNDDREKGTQDFFDLNADGSSWSESAIRVIESLT